jgi:aryl-alcohol dehydrogenase-like predicted oxidoreductase
MSVIKIIIPNTSLVVSKFIFGTSRLHKIFSKKERYNILKCAVDNGFTHFDTAPYYGFGLAEASLKEILKENSNLTITTKVGLYSPGGSNQNISSIWMRKISGKLFAKLSKPIVNFTINQAEKSLEENSKQRSKIKIKK